MRLAFGFEVDDGSPAGQPRRGSARTGPAAGSGAAGRAPPPLCSLPFPHPVLSVSCLARRQSLLQVPSVGVRGRTGCLRGGSSGEAGARDWGHTQAPTQCPVSGVNHVATGQSGVWPPGTPSPRAVS